MESHKRLYSIAKLTFFMLVIISSCKQKRPDVSEKIVTDKSRLNAAGSVQLEDIIKNGKAAEMKALNLKNGPNVFKYYEDNAYNLKWSNKGSLTPKADTLIKFLKDDCKYWGLFPKSYTYSSLQQTIDKLTKTDESKNAVLWAKADAMITDVFFQVVKHIRNGRLYADTNYRYFDSTLHKNLFVPAINSYCEKTNLNQEIAKWEPNFNEYDSLKIAIKSLFAKEKKSYTYVKYPYTDSAQFTASLLKRISEDGVSVAGVVIKDSMDMVEIVKKWQTNQGLQPNGAVNADLISGMNENGLGKFNFAALSMDKLKAIKIPHNGNYVMVNIPSYYLRAYKDRNLSVESKVAVGKTITKTPEMESEISQLILMPNWYVPPSILKIPGYIERHRGKKNFIVKGKTVIQKSGPGNALGEMKFNFKSSDAIYLHDTNEKWAFGASKRAVSHGCVRVQQYKNLGDYIASVSPIFERGYRKVLDKYVMVKDSLGKVIDSTPKFKYTSSDSTVFNGDSVVTRLLKNKIHKEITVGKKVPIYIKYFTCAARNGNLVIYPDIYGHDKELLDKYFKGLSL